MKDVVSILESTYLKTAKQAGIEEFENKQRAECVAQEAIDYGFKLVMVRAKYVPEIKRMIKQQNSKLLVGTVIDFPKGCSSLEDKLKIAAEAIHFGADELDFVINYEAFKRGELDVVRAEVKRCTCLCLENQKVAKWIIEIAALSEKQIMKITQLIREVVEKYFFQDAKKVYIKSSTGFYILEDGSPIGATPEGIKIMSDYSGLLPLKAAGGVRSLSDVKRMVSLGVSRIGTSSAKQIVLEEKVKNKY